VFISNQYKTIANTFNTFLTLMKILTKTKQKTFIDARHQVDKCAVCGHLNGDGHRLKKINGLN
jgi:hypothetical protein